MNRKKEVLLEKGIKQKWFVEKVVKNYNTFNSYVQNRRQPSFEVLVQIANILDINVKELLVSTKIEAEQV